MTGQHQPVLKRLFDIIGALCGLVLVSPVLAAVAVLIKLDSRGTVFFKQKRMGRGFQPFWIYKFRTMKQNSESTGPLITIGEDLRITRVGRFLRKAKIDELPQLINVLKGEMSFVGPRPELPRYVDLFRRDYATILAIRPGITDLGSVKYRDEAALLAQAEDPEREYVTRVLPDKIKLANEYLERSSFLFDLRVIITTAFKLLDRRSAPGMRSTDRSRSFRRLHDRL